MSFLHLQGIALIPYLHDMLIYSPALEQLQTDRDRVLSTLESLGWMVSWEKSSLDPSQSKVYLGYRVDSVAQRVFFLPLEKISRVQGAVSALHETGEASLRTIMRVLGLMSSCIPSVPWAQLHFQGLQGFLLSSLDMSISLWRGKKLPRLLAQSEQPIRGSDLDTKRSTKHNNGHKCLGLGSSLGRRAKILS